MGGVAVAEDVKSGSKVISSQEYQQKNGETEKRGPWRRCANDGIAKARKEGKKEGRIEGV